MGTLTGIPVEFPRIIPMGIPMDTPIGIVMGITMEVPMGIPMRIAPLPHMLTNPNPRNYNTDDSRTKSLCTQAP